MADRKTIRYRDGYKYQLAETYRDQVPIYPRLDIKTQFISLSRVGALAIRAGYASDGPSGPTVDTKTFMRGAFVHDALCQLMRMGLLDRKVWAKPAHGLLRAMCVVDGMWRVRAWWTYWGLVLGGRGRDQARERQDGPPGAVGAQHPFAELGVLGDGRVRGSRCVAFPGPVFWGNPARPGPGARSGVLRPVVRTACPAATGTVNSVDIAGGRD